MRPGSCKQGLADVFELPREEVWWQSAVSAGRPAGAARAEAALGQSRSLCLANPCIPAASSSPASPCLPLPFALSDRERLVCPCRVCGQVKGPGWQVQGLKGPRDHVQSPRQNSRVQSSPWLWPPCSVTSRGRSLGLPGCRLWTALAVQPQYGPQSSCP